MQCILRPLLNEKVGSGRPCIIAADSGSMLLNQLLFSSRNLSRRLLFTDMSQFGWLDWRAFGSERRWRVLKTETKFWREKKFTTQFLDHPLRLELDLRMRSSGFGLREKFSSSCVPQVLFWSGVRTDLKAHTHLKQKAFKMKIHWKRKNEKQALFGVFRSSNSAGSLCVQANRLQAYAALQPPCSPPLRLRRCDCAVETRATTGKCCWDSIRTAGLCWAGGWYSDRTDACYGLPRLANATRLATR